MPVDTKLVTKHENKRQKCVPSWNLSLWLSYYHLPEVQQKPCLYLDLMYLFRLSATEDYWPPSKLHLWRGYHPHTPNPDHSTKTLQTSLANPRGAWQHHPSFLPSRKCHRYLSNTCVFVVVGKNPSLLAVDAFLSPYNSSVGYKYTTLSLTFRLSHFCSTRQI